MDHPILNLTGVEYEANDNVSQSTETSTSESSDKKQLVSGYINLLVPPVLITIGVTCNLMIILTMRTKHFRKVSTSVYLKAGAFNDVLALLISLSAHWLYVNFPEVYVRTDSSHIMCKFFNFYGSGNNDFGILVTASMTAERAFVIVSPFGAARHCTTKRAWKIVVGITGFVILKDMHYLISSDIVPEGRNDRLCDVFPERFKQEYQVFYSDMWPWIHLSYVLICAVAILISNIVILHFVRRSTADKHSGGHKWRHLLPMLIGESILIMILTFPFSMHLALLAIRLRYDTDLYSDPKKAATENLVFNATFYMLYSHKCATFFMYCVTGSRFRDGLSTALIESFCPKSFLDERPSPYALSIVSSRSISSRKLISPRKLTRDSNASWNCSKSTCTTCDSISENENRVNCDLELVERTQKSISVYI
ncbi:hypothetical protein ACF0H5_019636 [Mactra antiquata]